MNETQFLSTLLHFKTQKCKVKHPENQNDACPFYHNDSDSRRSPFISDGNCLLYHNIYFLPKLVPESNRFGFCLNLFEYNYHPLNYKTKPCPYLSVNEFCSSGKFCPYLHSDDDLCGLSEVRKQFLNSKILPDISSGRIRSANTQTPILPRKMHHICNLQNGEQAYILGTQIDLQEDNQHEFKTWALAKNLKRIRDDLEEYICAFANSSGGTIYIGISDDGVVVGTVCSREISNELKLSIADMVVPIVIGSE